MHIAQDFYESIGEANIWDALKACPHHTDPGIRSKACSALGNMCRHTPYFYDALVCLSGLIMPHIVSNGFCLKFVTL